MDTLCAIPKNKAPLTNLWINLRAKLVNLLIYNVLRHILRRIISDTKNIPFFHHCATSAAKAAWRSGETYPQILLKTQKQ